MRVRAYVCVCVCVYVCVYWCVYVCLLACVRVWTRLALAVPLIPNLSHFLVFGLAPLARLSARLNPRKNP